MKTSRSAACSGLPLPLSPKARIRSGRLPSLAPAPTQPVRKVSPLARVSPFSRTS